MYSTNPGATNSQHRVSEFGLVDRTRPGHRRFIALWLVNPNQRVISTANVPPQQADWWAEATVGGPGLEGAVPPEVLQLLAENLAETPTNADGQTATTSTHGKSGPGGLVFTPEVAQTLSKKSRTRRLPTEIVDLVRQEAGPMGIMSRDEARQHRAALMAERTVVLAEAQKKWAENQFSFCEH